MDELTSQARFGARKLRVGPRHAFLIMLIFAVGVFARTWEWGRLPPGLNPDEASNGVDAYDLLHFGVDRNGVAFPVKFVSWGSGQDALYGYLLVPVIAILGLTPAAIRFPMLAYGILTLPLFYWLGRKLFDPETGLVGMFFLAISPWHVLLSRWSLEANLLPLVFLVGFLCLLGAREDGRWFMAACAFFGLSLYAYGTAYAFAPTFLLIVLATMVSRQFTIPLSQGIAGAMVFLLFLAPIATLVVVNSFGLPSIQLGPVTIPRFPVEARFQEATVFGSEQPFRSIGLNLVTALRLLVLQTDGIAYNVVDPYGYFYTWSFPLAILGVGLLALKWTNQHRVELLWLLAWLAAAFTVAAIQSVNVNRFNIIFLPLILVMAHSVVWLNQHLRGILAGAAIVLAFAFGAFTLAYHGAAYRRQIDFKFDAGLLTALHSGLGPDPEVVCVTDRINMPYIFVLFANPVPPREYLRTVQYEDPASPLRQVRSFGRYVFGTENCTASTAYTYVLTSEEVPPRLGNRYDQQFFDNFVVYQPRP